MITKEHYDKSYFCKEWAATPQIAKEKLRGMYVQAWKEYLEGSENAQMDIDDLKEDYKLLQVEAPEVLYQLTDEEAWKRIYDKFAIDFLTAPITFDQFRGMVQEKFILNGTQQLELQVQWEDKEEILTEEN